MRTRSCPPPSSSPVPPTPGRALAEDLAADDLILHGRSQAKLDQIANQIAAQGATRPRTVTADFADLDQVRGMAAQVRAMTGRLEVLVNNAGIGSGEPDGRTRRTSADSHELRFAVNYLAGFELTLELLPLLRTSAPARIVNVASIGQHPIDFDDLMLEHGYDGMRAYGQSKLAQIMSGFDLATRLPADEVTVNSLHPATYMPTKIVLAEVGHSIDTLEQGAAATRRLITEPALAGVTGRFYDRTNRTTAHAQAYDTRARLRLWQTSMKLTNASPYPA